MLDGVWKILRTKCYVLLCFSKSTNGVFTVLLGVEFLEFVFPGRTMFFSIETENQRLEMVVLHGFYQLSHEKHPGWLGYIGDYTSQLYRDYNKH